MKTIFSFIFALGTLLPCLSFGQGNQELFQKEVERIAAHVDSKKITRTEGLKEVLAASKSYVPNDRLSQSYFQSIIEYSEQLDKKTISRKKYDELFAARTERYQSALEDKERSERQRELENDRIRQAQAEAYNEAIRQQQSALTGAAMLQGVGKAFNNSFGQSIIPPPQICNFINGGMYCN